MRGLILAVSDKTYINKIKSEQKLIFYEDLKDNHLSNINENFFKGIIERCSFHDSDVFDFDSTEEYGKEYKMYKHVLAKILYSFNRMNYLDRRVAYDYIELCENYKHHLQLIIDCQCEDEDMDESISYPFCIYLNKLPVQALLKFVIIIYEIKFIFGDINSKCPDLNLY
ncbi:hypothetical protein RF11_04919 [Thelohanellus kitauei]|uniref:Uncharacterized protein n=1 Tax=Thelohanellus kitauei TaxID=669202 RepID=A0A0C2JSD8_THEKT|nr:hypothetical protein RF11_04919 [Thelohanellus kitauei]